MARCAAKTKTGYQCLKRAIDSGDFCSVHADQISWGSILFPLGSAIALNALLPGAGSLVVGAFSGDAARKYLKETRTPRKKVFVSFDYDNDRALKDFLVGQARNPRTPFEIVNHSLKEASAESAWQAKARAAIRRSDIVLVIAGTHTYRARGVLKEVVMAREAGIPIVQVIGYNDKSCPAVPGAGQRYNWTWDNLKHLLS